MHDAFEAAVRTWSDDGIPEDPTAWLYRTAQRRVLDKLRAGGRHHELQYQLANEPNDMAINGNDIPEERLRLIYTCCHPSLSREAQVALTLRTLGGLTANEVARAFLVSDAAMQQRLVRAKRKIRNAGIAYELPDPDAQPARTTSVLTTLYLIFNEGYAANSGDTPVRRDLCVDALDLCGMLCALMPNDSEALSLWALMLLQHSRRDARVDAQGDPILLDDQDRSLWDRECIDRARALLARASGLPHSESGTFYLQARIASHHAFAPTADAVDWNALVSDYDRLLSVQKSPVIQLNRAVALSMAEGPRAGLKALDHPRVAKPLAAYLYYHAARGELLQRLDKVSAAKTAFRKALGLADNASQKRFLEKKISALTG